MFTCQTPEEGGAGSRDGSLANALGESGDVDRTPAVKLYLNLTWVTFLSSALVTDIHTNSVA